MSAESEIRQAILDELQRQAENDPDLKVVVEEDRVVVNGAIDLDDLVMVVLGSVAGGP